MNTSFKIILLIIMVFLKNSAFTENCTDLFKNLELLKKEKSLFEKQANEKVDDAYQETVSALLQIIEAANILVEADLQDVNFPLEDKVNENSLNDKPFLFEKLIKRVEFLYSLLKSKS